jgi:hypothetical protein
MGTEMKSMLITEAQAGKLQERVLLARAAQERVTEALDLLGLPLDKPINMLTDAGPDENGMIRVQWEVPDAPPAPPKSKAPAKPRRRKKE